MSSSVVGTFSASKQVGFKGKNGSEEELRDEKNKKLVVDDDDEANNNGDDDNDDDDGMMKSEKELDLGPQFSLKEELEKDKDDESLRRWKEQLLGSVDMFAVGESKEPEVTVLSLSILCPGRPDIILPTPFSSKPKNSVFMLKEGSKYSLKFSFKVSNNIVSGLKYTNTVWKTGVRAHKRNPCTYELEEETTPSGLFARGSYSARTKFVDDDSKVYLDVGYLFEIQKNWPSLS
ncbi:hypothetical protein V6N13_008969 [Hibiscus sabdariffa]|uniref:Rho GDP-dissociation inhibitor 1-like n=1 Tax=Hibiscus sabdariffa TaxID=183260 RepID=A0ABR2NR03_9ROSI